MKRKLFSLLLLALAALSATGGAGISIGSSNVSSFDVAQFNDRQLSLIGKVVCLRFNFRSNEIHRDADGSARGVLRQYNRDNVASMFESVDVKLPRAAWAWFEKLPTNYEKAYPNVVYARVGQDRQGYVVLELLGVNVRRDISGTGEVTWPP
jgi:hypothetical protein